MRPVSDSSPYSSTRWGVVLIIWAAGLGAGAQYGKISIVFEQLGLLYPEAGNALSLTMSMVGLIGILCGVVAGGFVSAFGYRRTLVWALWIGALMSALQALFLPFGLFLATRLIEGISHIGIVVAAPTLIPQICAPRHRGTGLSIWSTFFGVSFALLVWVGLPLVQSCGVMALFAAHGAVMAVLALVLGRMLKTVQVPPRSAYPRLDGLVGLHLSLYRAPRLVAPAAGWLFYTSCFVALMTVLPPFLDEEIRRLVMSALPLVSIAASMTLGVWLLRLAPAVRIIQAGFALAAAVALGLGLGEGISADRLPLLLLLLGGFLLLAVGFGLIQCASFASVPQLNPEPDQQALANGAMSQAGNMGNAIGTPLMVAVISVAGYAGLTTALALLLCGGLLVHAFLAHLRRA